MNFALEFAQTGHLAMGTLHANNANQAIDRVLGFFPIEKQKKLRADIALNLKAVISQRLIRTLDGGRCAGIEILLNSPLIAEMIVNGDIGGIKTVMSKSKELGMQTFDQALFDFYEAGRISLDEALKNADGMNELRLRIKLEGKAAKGRDALAGLEHMSLAAKTEEK
jgi:twitching motility protein PilU